MQENQLNLKKGQQNMSKAYITAAEIAEAVGVSASTAYKIIKKLNAELEKGGYVTLAGKVSRTYFNERWYGGVG